MAFQHRVFANVLLMVLVGTVATGSCHAVEPLDNAHAHNDYWHQRPLFDALDHGFASVEADIFLRDGKLLIGHELKELNPEKTLESLYLEPLARRVRENGGRVHPGGSRFFLLIDIKSDAQETYAKLRNALSSYAEMLTSIERGEIRPGAVTVVISGNRPSIEPGDAARRFAGLDGRLTDLESDAPAHLMPMISDAWPAHFKWRGDGPMPATESAKLKEIVQKSHAAGRVVRFWATPKNESLWRELRSAGVDLIGTDQLGRLARFLRTGY
jgi:hypothetical protein